MSEVKQRTFLDLGEIYVTHFLAGHLTEETLVKFNSIRECLLECYRILVYQKELRPVEGLSESEKHDIWNECKKYCEPLSGKERMKFVKAYWALYGLMQKRV